VYKIVLIALYYYNIICYRLVTDGILNNYYVYVNIMFSKILQIRIYNFFSIFVNCPMLHRIGSRGAGSIVAGYELIFKYYTLFLPGSLRESNGKNIIFIFIGVKK